MKRLFFSYISALCLILSLTSCEVHWFFQSYEAPWYVVAVPTVIFIAAVTLLTGWILSKRNYRCSQCGKAFHPPLHSSVISIHIGDRRLFRCPHCGHKGFCNPTRED